MRQETLFSVQVMKGAQEVRNACQLLPRSSAFVNGLPPPPTANTKMPRPSAVQPLPYLLLPGLFRVNLARLFLLCGWLHRLRITSVPRTTKSESAQT